MITVDLETDVLVVGAGASGVPAAIAAARAGARVVLLEEDFQPGGAPVDNYITMPCGKPRAGVYGEMLQRLETEYPLPLPDYGPTLPLWSRWHLPSSYAVVIADMLAAEENLDLHCGVRVQQPRVEDGPGGPRVTGVVVPRCGGGTAQVRAHVTVDATGAGSLAAAAGCTVLYGEDSRGEYGEPHAPPEASRRVQPCTWLYIYQRLGGGHYIDPGESLRGVDPTFGWVGADRAKAEAHNSGIYLMWGRTLECADTGDEQALAATQCEALRLLRDDLARLQRCGYMTYLAPRMGVRESRRIRGERVVTESDLRSGRMPEDYIAVGHWWLDIWGQQLPEEQRQVPAFGIPYAALLPQGMDGLLVVGKSISITHIALGAYRVQPPVAAVGQAAGVAAALAVRERAPLRAVDPVHIRREATGCGQGMMLDPEQCQPNIE